MVVDLPGIDILDLDFRYPGETENSLTQIRLNINAGERFGVFGPNGAGKTTLLHCMTGLLSPASGEIRMMGQQIHEGSSKTKKLIGLVPQDFAFYQELRPSENLEYFGALAGMKKEEIKNKTRELLEVLELQDDKEVRYLSGGMKRRVNLAIGVIHEPRILFLDEPTVGVDVHTRQSIVSYLLALNAKGTTLVYTSHQLSEAEEICETIALLHQGRLVAQGKLKALLEQHRMQGLEELFISLTENKMKGAQ